MERTLKNLMKLITNKKYPFAEGGGFDTQILETG
jgi:hypothetical protein